MHAWGVGCVWGEGRVCVCVGSGKCVVGGVCVEGGLKGWASLERWRTHTRAHTPRQYRGFGAPSAYISGTSLS